jgi:hypothetical protein
LLARRATGRKCRPLILIDCVNAGLTAFVDSAAARGTRRNGAALALLAGVIDVADASFGNAALATRALIAPAALVIEIRHLRRLGARAFELAKLLLRDHAAAE